MPSSPAFSSNTPGIREIIEDNVHEGLKKMVPAAERPASHSTAEIDRKRVQQAVQPVVLADAVQEPPALTYAAVLRRSLLSPGST